MLKKIKFNYKTKCYIGAFLLFIFLLAAFYLAVTFVNSEEQTSLVSGEVSSWGLTFFTEGETPTANVTSEVLADYGGFYVGDEDSNKIYLTFDAGYENGYTSDILDVLEAHGVQATFFLVGNYLETEPELVMRMYDEGHYIGNHTWSHPDMSEISTEEEFSEELLKFEEKLTEIIGTTSSMLYRPPQGKFSEENLLMAQEMGYTTVFWSLAYVDWYVDDQPTHEEAFDKLLSRIHPGAVVLLHSTSATNAEILDELLTEWENMGYEFGDIMELCN